MRAQDTPPTVCFCRTTTAVPGARVPILVYSVPGPERMFRLAVLLTMTVLPAGAELPAEAVCFSCTYCMLIQPSSI